MYRRATMSVVMGLGGGLAWDTPTLLETRDTASAVVPRLAVGSSGVAAAVWIYFAELEIWANILL